MATPQRVLRNLHLENVQKLSTPLKIPASPFMKNLGYGTCVSVYKFERGISHSPWAVKRVSQRYNKEENSKIFNARIQREADILRKLSHPNIVGFRSVTKSSDGLETLALECCSTSLGSILEERFENEFGPLSAVHTLKMIKDISNALDYLHTEAKILHGDLKSFNVLVKGEFEICKLCDFGVSIPMNENGLIDFNENPEIRYIGSSNWSAPEVLDESDIIDCKADIFSFGLIIYETIALIPPHTIGLKSCCDDNEENNENDDKTLNDTTGEGLNKTADESLNKTTDESLEQQIEEMELACGTRPPLPQAFEMTEDYNQIIEIFYCCTAELPEERPTAKAILMSINEKTSEKV